MRNELIAGASIDAGAPRAYPAGSALGAGGRGRRWRGPRAALAVVVALAGAACATVGPQQAAGPPLDGLRIATELEEGTRLQEPARVVFDWNLNEQGSRASGRGVARAEPPYRARLDLFLGSGETVAAAALVEGVLRLPAGVPDGVIPPADLLWASLGVFRPGPGAVLLGAQRMGEGVQLRYSYEDGQELRYRIEQGRIREVELLQGGRALHRVTLNLPEEEGGYPREATYRNLGAFRELRLVTRSIEVVDAYPPDIWFPTR